jgi:sulfotransferase
MPKTIHFISGLPRSGSTLLCNILAQNPEFHTTPTSACHEALFVLRNSWNEWIEHKAAKSLSATHNQQRVLSSVLNSYHDTDKPVIFDKGRGWLSLLELAELALGQQAKVLVPVRSIPSICASFEKLHRKAAAYKADDGNYFQAQTTEGRVNHMLEGDQPVGLAYNRLRDALQRGFVDRLFFVEFDYLTHRPQETMEAIYKFLDLPLFDHDFDNVEQVTYEDDSIHGLDLHTIRKSVRPVLDDSIEVLGADLHKRLSGSEFWRPQ